MHRQSARRHFSEDEDSISTAVLRSRAEEQLRENPEMLAGKSPDEVQALVHELNVHQIELEMQNEQLRLTQTELEVARERYIDLYDFAPVGYITVNAQGVIVSANLTSVNLLHVERSHLVGTAFSKFVVPEDQSAYYLCWRKAMETPGSHSCEICLSPAGHPPFPARIEGGGTTGEMEGEPVCRWVISDIGAEILAREALRKNEQQRIEFENNEWKRLALDAGDMGAWDQDLRTGQSKCSDRACVMLGFPVQTAISWESFLDRVHPDDHSEFIREVEKANDAYGPRRCDVTFRVVVPGGEVRWLRFVARCSFEADVRPRAVRRTGVLADITRQKEAEELLESRAKQLEVLVRERTARLQDALGELEHFSYTMAHDLRAPLRSIAGFSGLLLDQCQNLSPLHRRFLERSNTAVQRMDQLIIDALNYNKLVREKFTLEPVDCATLLGDLIDSYPQLQEAKDCIFITKPIPMVLGNQALLTQCFSNLLNNAIKFVPKGTEPHVRIFAHDLDGKVRICFQDNGIGIPEESHQMVFKMFQRLNHDYEGTGIGLALVKKAAERMQGAVGVESRGQGSCFWLELKKP